MHKTADGNNNIHNNSNDAVPYIALKFKT